MSLKESTSAVTDEDMLRCASCGKSEDAKGIGKLKTCTACKSVKYCSVDCQRNHRKVHKKECKRIEKEVLEGKQYDLSKVATTLDNANDGEDDDLFNPPPKDECPLCFLSLPIEAVAELTTYLTCCGKRICRGCHLKDMAVWNWTNAKRKIKDPPEQPLEATCAFCREKVSRVSDKSILQRIEERIALNDHEAICQLAGFYSKGQHGLPKDKGKEVELNLRAVELGSVSACWNLACWFRERDHFKYMHFIKLGTKRGHVVSRHRLGYLEHERGNDNRAVRHWMISAAAGDADSLENIGRAYRNKLVTKDQYEEAIRSHQKAKEEMSSFERDMAKRCAGGVLDPSFFSETELATLCGVRESERAFFSRCYAAQICGAK